MKALELTAVVGARPNFIKMAALVHELKNRPHLSLQLIHTGQHYSPEMSDSFFNELDLPQPHFNLGVGGGTHTTQTAEIMRLLEPVLSARRPDAVLVVGDVNSTLATSLVAAQMGIRIAHVEAGLRSFDRDMPEEINRMVTDVLSDFLFVSEPSGVTNLLAEGVSSAKIFLVGNVMIDTLLRCREKAQNSCILDTLRLVPRQYAVVTLHRPSNVDDAGRLKGLLGMLIELASRFPVVFPMHPRTRQRVEQFGLRLDGLILTRPLSYLDFLRVMSDARIVLTDSGGIQEETTILGVPCLTLRENTERPITLEKGTNRLVGTNPDTILNAALEAVAAPPGECRIPELWDGHAARRVLDVLEPLLG